MRFADAARSQWRTGTRNKRPKRQLRETQVRLLLRCRLHHGGNECPAVHPSEACLQAAGSLGQMFVFDLAIVYPWPFNVERLGGAQLAEEDQPS